jgi:hypothetical protein
MSSICRTTLRFVGGCLRAVLPGTAGKVIPALDPLSAYGDPRKLKCSWVEVNGYVMTQMVGACLCRRVRYSVDAEPGSIGVCHSTDCQRFTGSAFATVIAVPASAFRLTGTLKTFSKQGDSGKSIHRRFCPECGSSIVDEADALPGIAMLNAGSLDDRSWVRPRSEIYCDSAQPLVHLGGELKRFAKTPA